MYPIEISRYLTGMANVAVIISIAMLVISSLISLSNYNKKYSALSH